jgi:hypothetical protein
MKAFRLGWCVGLLAVAGCPADDSMDDGNDDASMTTMPTTTDAGNESDTAGDSSGGPAPSHADIQPIWDAHCVDACHEVGGEWAVLDMSGSAYDKIVGVAAATFSSLDHVDPGNLDTSYLWQKMNNTHLAVGGNGVAMPKARVDMAATVLSADELDLVEAWIVGGAQP